MSENQNKSQLKSSDNQAQKLNMNQASFPEVYSNVIQTNYNPYEFELTFGLVSRNYEGIRPVVNARITPQLAKEFARNLAVSVKMFEEQFGEIKLPDTDKKKP